jgi:NTP pyrophosphatase (non-canonical NTP hydrolase)|tara:strand:+ start:8685 stop:9518 length:834 start_codon:yes stop_codon:yes gene_type:complete
MKDIIKIMYYIYHIPGKKIGVARNLKYRVTLMQGYQPGEFEVLDQSDDIDYISNKEIELQKSHGYKVDPVLYKNLFNNKKKDRMTITFSNQTTTFPYERKQLKTQLHNHIGHKWETEHGLFEIKENNIDWIASKAQKSMFNENKSYIYNKVFADYLTESKEESSDVFSDIRAWAKTRGLYEKGDVKTQYVKLMEESGELAQSIIKEDHVEFVDAIGDMVVVLTNLAHLGGVKIEDCIDAAYKEISNRKGSMINGSFVKVTPSGTPNSSAMANLTKTL